MPVIKQSTGSSSILVRSSGKSSGLKSVNDSPINDLNSQKEKEYQIKLDPIIFKKNLESKILSQQNRVLRTFTKSSLEIEDFSDLENAVSNVDNQQTNEIQNPNTVVDRLTSSFSGNRITSTSQDSIDDTRISQLVEVVDLLPDDTFLLDFTEGDFVEGDFSIDEFSFTSLGKLIERSRKSMQNTNIKVLSHEIFKINKLSSGEFDTNLLFLDFRSQENSTLLNLKNSEIEIKESHSDRLFLYVDDFKHNELIQESYNKSIRLVNKINKTSKLSNRLENEINYGNIIENFIKEGKSDFIGKISNQILLNSNNYKKLTGGDDEVLLDLQHKSSKSILSKENLEIFYKNISGFDYKEKDVRFSNSVSNFKIVNTDRLVGQFMVNYAVGQNSIYPNSDDVLNLNYYSSSIRKKINGDAFNKYPIIQFKDLNINSRIFSNKKLEFLAVTGNTLNIDKVLKNIDETLVNENYEPLTVINSLLFFSVSDIIDTGEKYNEGEDTNTRGTSYKNRKSLAGKKSVNRSNQNEIDNNIFSIKAVDKDPNRVTGDQSFSSNEFLFEKIYLDVDTKYNSSNAYLLPCFLKLPTRYFTKNTSPNSIERLEEGNDVTLTNRSIADLSSHNNRSSIDSESEIKDKIKESLFSGPYNFSEDVNTGGNDVGSLLNNSSFGLSYINAVDSFLDFLKVKYSKFINGGENTLNNTVKITSTSSSTSFESYLDDYVIRTKDNISITTFSDFATKLQNIRDSDDDVDNISSLFNTSLKDRGNIYESDIEKIKNDCFVFSTSNSFLNSKEIKDVILSNYSNKKIKDLGLNDIKIKSIKDADERFLNKRNTTDNVLSVFSEKNNVAHLTLKISNVINLIRKKRSDNKIFQSIFDKVKSKIVQQDNFTLLYDTFKENCIDTFEESPFITSKGFYKNNFVEEFNSENKNTTKLVIDKDNDIEDNKLFTSKEFRKYLSKIYTKSFVRSKSTLLNRILSDNIDMFELESDYPRSFSNISNYFGFDVLLAKSLSGINRNNANEVKDVCKIILANSIIKSCGIDSQIKSVYKLPSSRFGGKSSSKTLNKDISDDLRKIFGEEIINNFVNVIFNKENIYSMNNKIIRSVHTNSMNNIKSFNLTSVDAINGLSLDYVDGNMCELVFPGHYVVKEFGKKEDAIKSVSGSAIRKSSTINDNFFSSQANINNKKRELRENLYQASSNMSYNYDVFINEEETGTVFYEKSEEDSSYSKKGFNFAKDEINKGIDLKITYNLFKRVLKSDIRGLNNDGLGKLVVPYRNSFVYIPMSYFYLSTKRNTFSRKITDICTDLLSVFDIKYDNINNVEEVFKFIDNNTYLTRITQDILEVFSIIYLQSFESYNTYTEEKIRLESINKDMSIDEFRFFVKDYNILNSSIENRSFVVSDIKSILSQNSEQLENPEYQTSDIILQNSPAVINRDVIHTKRFFELQVVNKILQNSDISESLCLDIIHGYFANLESNKILEIENKKELEKNIEEISKTINSIQGISSINIQDHIFDEFYQNKLSKDIQEIMFYKNIFNETFIRNNLYNSNRQKYENENMFNHRKLFYNNSYNRGLQSLNLIGNYSSSEVNSLLDILKIPIDFKIANKIGTRGFLKINIQPVNLKYPEIEYKSISKYYTPMLTGLTSNFMSSLSSNFFDFCGIYNDTQKISERYNVVSKDIAISEVKNLLSDIFSLAAEEGRVVLNANTSLLSSSVYDDNIISSAISHLDFITQSPLNENIKLNGEKLDNLINKETISLLNSVDIESLKNAIGKIDENILSDDFVENDKEYTQTLGNSKVLKNNEFYHKFIKDLDRDMSQQDLILAMIPNNIYDVFNIVVNRDLISIDTGSSSNEIIDMGLGSFNSPVGSLNKSLCISYYISFEVL